MCYYVIDACVIEIMTHAPCVIMLLTHASLFSLVSLTHAANKIMTHLASLGVNNGDSSGSNSGDSSGNGGETCGKAVVAGVLPKR